MIMTYSKAHEAILNKMVQAPQVGTLKMRQNTVVRLLLLSIIAVLSQVSQLHAARYLLVGGQGRNYWEYGGEATPMLKNW